MHCGNSHGPLRFPGTVSLACGTLVKLVEDVLACKHSQGFTRLVLVKSHGGNAALLGAYAQERASCFCLHPEDMVMSIITQFAPPDRGGALPGTAARAFAPYDRPV